MSIIRGRIKPEREQERDIIIVGDSPYSLDEKTGKWKTADGENLEVMSIEEALKELKNREDSTDKKPESKKQAETHL